MDINHNIFEFKERWAPIEEGISKLKKILEGQESNFSSKEYITMYSTIYEMCTEKFCSSCETLYQKYKDIFQDYINSTVLPSLRGKHGEFLLMEFVKRWSNHKVMVRWLSRFFHYLDRYHVVRHQLHSLNDAGIFCFRDVAYQDVHANVRDAVITLIHNEREGEQIDRTLLKNVLGIFVEMGLGQLGYYQEDFEAHLLENTGAYYSRKASTWMAEYSCPDYMLKCQECLDKERGRSSSYLHPDSETKLLTRVRHELLVVQSTALLIDKERSGCRALLRDGKADDLCRMYNLYSIIPEGLKPIVEVFEKYVTAEGTALFQQAKAEDAVKKPDSNVAFINKVIELHDKYNLVYISNYFQNHSAFKKSLKKALELFCNQTVGGSSSAEIFAIFFDNILLKKGGTEKLADETVEEKFDKVVELLTYIHDKDLFSEFCRKKLALRLLSDRLSDNEYLERSILSKLKQRFSTNFTSKMEGMVRDILLSKENKARFEYYLSNNSSGIDFTVSVLTTGFWPTYKSDDLNLPAEMLKCVQAFKSFYGETTKNRKLTWIYSQGTCLINGKFEHKQIELVVSTYQAAVLLLFNDSVQLGYSEIESQLKLPDRELSRILHSLACGKYMILIKKPETKSITKTDSFVFNHKFTDRLRKRIKIPLPHVDDDKKKAVENIDQERRYAIDAVVVRIMKSRKVLGHQQLVSECIEQLNRMFKPDIKIIKRRIEDLITRDYLERDPNNPNSFKYIA